MRLLRRIIMAYGYCYPFRFPRLLLWLPHLTGGARIRYGLDRPLPESLNQMPPQLGGIGFFGFRCFLLRHTLEPDMENPRSWPQLMTGHGKHIALCIINDVEHGSHRPGNPLAGWSILPQGKAVPCVLESLFPEVRTLAYLSAAGGSPQRADWLAARVMVFSLDHLQLSRDELRLMDEVNLRLQTLSHKLLLECALVRSFSLVCGQRAWQTEGQGSHVMTCHDSPVAQSLSLRAQLASHLARLRAAMQSAIF